MQEEHEPFEDGEDVKSKTQVKNEMLALQKLGAAISELTREQQAKIPLDDTLRSTIEEAPKIKSNSAKKRHMQFIGKLMRSGDYEAIEQAYEDILNTNHRLTRQQHTIERWRDELIQNGDKMSAFIEEFPNTDRQQLRQLLRASQKEAAQSKPPASARKLFRFLRDTIQEAQD